MIKIHFRFAIFILSLVVTAAVPCLSQTAELRPPRTPFNATPQPAAPDYANNAAWAVWPGRSSKALFIPKGITGGLASDPKVDVFFIHPTTYLTNATWNAKYDEGSATGAQLEGAVLPYQASTFNGCCQIYVPRYRQATISTFLRPGADSNAAYDLAYSDVQRAFDYYLANANKGRPFILASHSQGSLHATRLLQDRILGNTDLRRRLVAAYVVGASLPQEIEWTGLPPCNTATQTGCIVDWNSVSAFTPLALGRGLMVTYGENRYQRVDTRTWLCINPLTWTRDGIADAAANKGALPFLGLGQLPALVLGVTGARCFRGRLVVKVMPSAGKGFADVLTRFGSYHNQDYSLFYASVRQNAIDRTNAFLQKTK